MPKMLTASSIGVPEYGYQRKEVVRIMVESLCGTLEVAER
jgi:hypothetical protein